MIFILCTASAESLDALGTSALALQNDAIEAVVAMMRSVMDAAGTGILSSVYVIFLR